MRRYTRRHVDSTKSTGADLKIGRHDVYAEFDRRTVWDLENYGEDADGNRGMLIWEQNEDAATNVVVAFYAGDLHRLTPLAKFTPSFQALVVSAIEKWLEDTPAEDDGDDEEEPERE